MLLRLRSLCLGLWCLGCAWGLKAQDLHFSQYDHQPLGLNPAYTGLFSGDLRLTANFRHQWFSVPVPYTTFAAGADMHLLTQKLEQDVFSTGLYFFHDKAGTSELSNAQALASVAYAKRLAPTWFLLFGFQAGLGQRRLRTDRLTFDDQYFGDQFNPNSASANLGRFERTSYIYGDWGAGLGMRWQLHGRSWLNMVWGISHLNAPRQSFLGTDARLLPKINLSGQLSLQANNRGDVLATASAWVQGTYSENVLGLGWRQHLSQSIGKEQAVFGQALYRFSSATGVDALIFMVGMDYLTWRFALSYDLTLSPFAVANQRNGGLELSACYILRRVRPLPTAKTCPIF